MDEIKFDSAIMGRLANAMAFICGADHPTTVAIKAAAESGSERDIKKARNDLAAWAGALIVDPERRSHLAGIESADSVTIDAHKWLSVPMGAGMFFCRHRETVADRGPRRSCRCG